MVSMNDSKEEYHCFKRQKKNSETKINIAKKRKHNTEEHEIE